MTDKPRNWQEGWKFACTVWGEVISMLATMIRPFLMLGCVPIVVMIFHDLYMNDLASGEETVWYDGILGYGILCGFLIPWFRAILGRGYSQETGRTLLVRFLRFIFAAFIFNFVVFFPAVVVVLVIILGFSSTTVSFEFEEVWHFIAIALPLFVLALYVFARSLLAFPMIAADAVDTVRDALFADARKIAGPTRSGIFFLILPGFAVATAVEILIGISTIPPIGTTVLLVVMEYIFYAWNCACLAVAYRRLIGEEPLNKEATT